MKTISGAYGATYNLSIPDNPLTVAQTAYLDVSGGVALYGAPGGNWNVVNAGKIVGEVDLSGGAEFQDLQSGSVTGDVDLTSASAGGGVVANAGNILGGVVLFNGGNIYNDQKAVINETGGISLYGVELSGAGKVTNAGAITGNAFGIVTSVSGADTVVNQNGGSISGAAVGVELGLPQSSSAGAVVTNRFGGAISGDSGVVANGASATVENSGYIQGTTLAVYPATLNGADYQLTVGDGVYLSAGGVVSNYAGGVIVGARYGVDVEGASAIVTNAGSIYGATGLEIDVAGGKATNTGVIRGSATAGSGVFLGAEAALQNSGRIIALAGAAVYAANGAQVANAQGGLFLRGVGVLNLAGYVTIGNAGKISGAGEATAAISLFSGEVTNGVTGAIVEAGLYAAGVKLSSVSLMTNAGQITVTGTYVDGVSLLDGGRVANSGTISVDGSYSAGVYLKNGGVVTNSGSIAVTGDMVFTGVYLKAGGKIVNQTLGVVLADNPVYAPGSAAIYNYGKLKGTSGVYLEAGGTIVNHAGAVIKSTATGESAIYLLSSGSVANSGVVSGLGHGVLMHDGGTVTNSAGGAITGVSVGVGLNIGASLNNSGSVAATYIGVFLGDVADSSAGGGAVGNLVGGRVSADTGLAATGTAASVTNAGVIVGVARRALALAGKTFELGDGISLFGGGAVVNQASGVIRGARYGVYVDGVGSVVTNAGQIVGATTAIDFVGSGANQLILQTGSLITGNVSGSQAAGATNALVLQGSGATANAFKHFNTLSVSAGANWALTNSETFGAVTIDGEFRIKDGLTGPITVENGGLAVFKSNVTGNLAFDGAGELDLGVAYAGQISGFGASDVFDLLGFTRPQTSFVCAENAGHTLATLTFKEAGTPTESLTLSGDYTKSEFALSAGAGGTGVLIKFV